METLKTPVCKLTISNYLNSSSNIWKTSTGFWLELHDVKPAISAKTTVAHENESAIGSEPTSSLKVQMEFSSIATFSSLSSGGTRNCFIMAAGFAIALLIGSGTIDFKNSRLFAEDEIYLLIGSGKIDFTNSRLVAEDDRLDLLVFP